MKETDYKLTFLVFLVIVLAIFSFIYIYLEEHGLIKLFLGLIK